jgi:group I intron endonuclease
MPKTMVLTQARVLRLTWLLFNKMFLNMYVSGVYKIQSILYPERCYIGSTNNFTRRRREHFYNLRNNKHDSPKLQNHYNKYGENDLAFSVVVECEEERAVVKEQCYINIFKPWFNISPTASSSLGIKRSDDFKQNLKVIRTGMFHTEEYCKQESIDRMGENNPFFGKHHSEEFKQQKREWNLAHGVKPPIYRGGRPKGAKNKPKQVLCQV